MALTPSTEYSNLTKLGNIQENWLFQLYYDDEGASDYLGFAFSDTTVDSIYYRGIVSNTPSIRSSIDLESSKAKTGNFTLELLNIDYKGADLSKIFLGGTNKYINRQVKVYSQLSGNTTLSDCLLIYNGRIIGINHNEAKISLQVVAKRPWDNIEIPNTKSDSNINIPVAYGDFTANTENTFQTGKTLFPIPISTVNGDNVYFISPKNYGAGAKPHFYDNNNDIFIIMGDDAEATVTYDGTDSVASDILLRRGTFYIRPNTADDDSDFTDTINGIDGDTGTDSYADVDAVQGGAGSDTDTQVFAVDMPRIVGVFSEVKMHIAGSVNMDVGTGISNILGLYDISFGEDVTVLERTSVGVTNTSGSGAGSAYTEIDLMDNYEDKTDSGSNLSGDINSTTSFVVETGSGTFSKGDIIKIDGELMKVVNHFSTIIAVVRGYSFSTAASHTSGTDIYKIGEGSYNMPSQIKLKASATVVSLIGTKYCNGRVVISDMYLKIKIQNDFDREPLASNEMIQGIDHLYLGSDGLDRSYTGGSGVVVRPHEAHRDMLARYTDYDSASIDGWDANFTTDREYWKMRDWMLEPTDVLKKLEQYQFEGGFIFTFENDSGRYIHIKNSYSSSDIDTTLKQNDIKNVKITHTPFNKIITKTELEFERHPAENKYLESLTVENNSARSDWILKGAASSKENVKKVTLKALVSGGDTIDTGTYNIIPGIAMYDPAVNNDLLDSAPNIGWANYYDNIYGDIKIYVSCDIVNPKYYTLECGDIVQLDDVGFEPFGDGFQTNDIVFMVTEISRKPGNMNVKLREVYRGS